MLRNASSTLSQQRSLSALNRALSSSSSCSSAQRDGEPSPVRSSYPAQEPNDQSRRKTKYVLPVLRAKNRPSVPKKTDKSEAPSWSHHSERPRMLRPPVLVERMKAAAVRGSLDDAIMLVKNAPADAQNTTVWNSLITQVLHKGMYKLAFSLFNDVSDSWVMAFT